MDHTTDYSNIDVTVHFILYSLCSLCNKIIVKKVKMFNYTYFNQVCICTLTLSTLTVAAVMDASVTSALVLNMKPTIF